MTQWNFGYDVDGGGGGGEAPFYNEGYLPDGYKPGNYYLPDVNLVAAGSGNIVADTVFVLPFTPRKTHTFTEMAILAGTTTGDYKLAIYASGNDGMPNNLILESPALTVTAAFLQYEISQELVSGQKYWLASIFSATPNMLGFINTGGTGIRVPISGPADGFQPFQFTTALMFNTPKYAHAFGTLPNPLTVDAMVTTGAWTPLILMKG